MSDGYMYKGSIDTVDADEQTVLVVRKHFFGILQLYIMSGVGIGIGFILVSLLLSEGISTTAMTLIAGAALAIIALVVLILLIATWIYFENKLVITNKNITQVLQRGIFHRQVSQLSMANVEDVTSVQQGFFATIFHYGTLKIETAGEQANFHFTYTPNSGAVAKQVLEARERFIEFDPDKAQRANPNLNVQGSGIGGTRYQHEQAQAAAQNQAAVPQSADASAATQPPQAPVA